MLLAHHPRLLPQQGNIGQTVDRGNVGEMNVQCCRNRQRGLTADVKWRKEVGDGSGFRVTPRLRQGELLACKKDKEWGLPSMAPVWTRAMCCCPGGFEKFWGWN